MLWNRNECGQIYDIKNLKAAILSQDYDISKTCAELEYLSYLGSLVTDDARCTREIKYRIITAKAAFKKKTLFTSKMDVDLRKELV
jgi:hypothetical protein